MSEFNMYVIQNLRYTKHSLYKDQVYWQGRGLALLLGFLKHDLPLCLLGLLVGLEEQKVHIYFADPKYSLSCLAEHALHKCRGHSKQLIVCCFGYLCNKLPPIGTSSSHSHERCAPPLILSLFLYVVHILKDFLLSNLCQSLNPTAFLL